MTEQLSRIDDVEKAYHVAKGMDYLMPTAMELQQYIRAIAGEPDETHHYIRYKPSEDFSARTQYDIQIQFLELDEYGVKVVSPLEDLIDKVDAKARDFDGYGIDARRDLGRYVEDYLNETLKGSYLSALRGHKGIPIPNELIVAWGAEKVEELVTKADNYGERLGKEYSEREAEEKARQEREAEEARQAQEEHQQVCDLENELKPWLPFDTGTVGLDRGSVVLRDYKEDLLAERGILNILTEILVILGLKELPTEISEEQRHETMRQLNNIYADGYLRAKDVFRDSYKRKPKYTWVFGEGSNSE